MRMPAETAAFRLSVFSPNAHGMRRPCADGLGKAVPLAADAESELLRRREGEDVFPVHVRRDERNVSEHGEHLFPRPLHELCKKDAAHARAHAFRGEGIGAADEIELMIPRRVRRPYDGAHVGGILQPVQNKAAPLRRAQRIIRKLCFRQYGLRRLFFGDGSKGIAAEDEIGRKFPPIVLPCDDALDADAACKAFLHHLFPFDKETARLFARFLFAEGAEFLDLRVVFGQDDHRTTQEE